MRRARRRLRRLFSKNGETGAALVEMAVAIAMLMILLVAVIEMGVAVWQVLSMNTGSEAGLLASTVYGTVNSSVAAVTASGATFPAQTATAVCDWGCPTPTGVTFGEACSNQNPTLQCGLPYNAPRQYARINASRARTSLLDITRFIPGAALPTNVSGVAVTRIK